MIDKEEGKDEDVDKEEKEKKKKEEEELEELEELEKRKNRDEKTDEDRMDEYQNMPLSKRQAMQSSEWMDYHRPHHQHLPPSPHPPLSLSDLLCFFRQIELRNIEDIFEIMMCISLDLWIIITFLTITLSTFSALFAHFLFWYLSSSLLSLALLLLPDPIGEH